MFGTLAVGLAQPEVGSFRTLDTSRKRGEPFRVLLIKGVTKQEVTGSLVCVRAAGESVVFAACPCWVWGARVWSA